MRPPFLKTILLSCAPRQPLHQPLRPPHRLVGDVPVLQPHLHQPDRQQALDEPPVRRALLLRSRRRRRRRRRRQQRRRRQRRCRGDAQHHPDEHAQHAPPAPQRHPPHRRPRPEEVLPPARRRVAQRPAAHDGPRVDQRRLPDRLVREVLRTWRVSPRRWRRSRRFGRFEAGRAMVMRAARCCSARRGCAAGRR